MLGTNFYIKNILRNSRTSRRLVCLAQHTYLGNRWKELSYLHSFLSLFLALLPGQKYACMCVYMHVHITIKTQGKVYQHCMAEFHNKIHFKHIYIHKTYTWRNIKDIHVAVQNGKNLSGEVEGFHHSAQDKADIFPRNLSKHQKHRLSTLQSPHFNKKILILLSSIQKVMRAREKKVL